ncbi:predicted protein [Uncinocarpus reesii 1704]|uniref:Uncharacterized protein n=1 Tax=Uncinocarpus reesii (strain UAMH 1704) TaxID=336963 RepID=C4JI38_UNCRE|nr:uncharacterized protein UREG_01463 [Uncinocarpus reesii 1704]EEP76614.1 predicted protein [Uncinocarpus reesii 1704]
MFGFCAYTVWDKFVWTPFITFVLQEAEEEETLEEEHEPGRELTNTKDEDEDDPLFVPLAMPSPVKGDLYSRDDPEWQNFIKISNDKKFLEKLKLELADLVQSALAKDPDLSKQMGQPISVNQAILTPVFPSRAPPEYDQLGFEFLDDGSVDAVIRRLPLEEGGRFRDIVLPTPLFFAILGAGLAFFELKMARLKSFLGGNSNRPQEGGQGIGSRQGLPSSFEPGTPQSRTALPHNQSNYPRGTSLQESIPKVESSSELHSNENSTVKSFLSFAPKPDPDLLVVTKIFHSIFNDLSHGLSIPRGSFAVRGLIGLKGSRGVCTIGATGIYDPVQKSWTGLRLKLKTLSPRVPESPTST